MSLDFLLFLSGLAVVAKFSTVAVESAVKLSQITGMSKTLIGFIFIGLSTSLPELAVGVVSSLGNNGHLSAGNVIGANITNLTLILGLMAFTGFNLGKIFSRQLKDAIAVTTGIALILLFMGTATLLFGLFCVCLYYTSSAAIAKRGIAIGDVNAESAKAAIRLLASVAAVVTGAYIVTNSAVTMSEMLGISSPILGATILSIGTTLPELSVNVAAVKKRNISLAVGDTIGTITSNLALILGVAIMINPISITRDILFLAAFLAAINSIVYVLAGRMTFWLKESLLLISLYVLYILFAVVGTKLL
jgi:cation:H+ antiporter